MKVNDDKINIVDGRRAAVIGIPKWRKTLHLKMFWKFDGKIIRYLLTDLLSPPLPRCYKNCWQCSSFQLLNLLQLRCLFHTLLRPFSRLYEVYKQLQIIVYQLSELTPDGWIEPEVISIGGSNIRNPVSHLCPTSTRKSKAEAGGSVKSTWPVLEQDEF